MFGRLESMGRGRTSLARSPDGLKGTGVCAGPPASAKSRRDDHGHLRADEDLGRREPRIAKEELPDLVALDGATGRHVVLDYETADRSDGEDRLPRAGAVLPDPAVGEDETEGAAVGQELVRVPLEELDVREPGEPFARDRDALRIELDGDDRAERSRP